MIMEKTPKRERSPELEWMQQESALHMLVILARKYNKHTAGPHLAEAFRLIKIDHLTLTSELRAELLALGVIDP